MTRIAFCDITGGPDMPALVYHLAYMLADQGRSPPVVDLDPTSRLTSMCLSEDRLDDIWCDDDDSRTIDGCVRLLLSDYEVDPTIEKLHLALGLLPGGPELAVLEEPLADAWARSKDIGAFVASSMVHRATSLAEQAHAADIVLMHLGPGRGAVNRAALLTADHIVLSLTPNLISLHGLRVLGWAVATWRTAWQARSALPPVHLQPLGYIVTMPGAALSRQGRVQHWYSQISAKFRYAWRDASKPTADPSTDPWCLGLMRDYPGLRTLAREARRPMFHLRPADGAIGAQMTSVVRCREDFDRLARTLLTRAAELAEEAAL